MITKFSVLYVGFTELDNVGLGGTPPDERRLSNDQIVKAYPMALDVAKHMDKLGFYALWGAEHHFQREGYEVVPNLILWGTYLADHTERLKIGCASTSAPYGTPSGSPKTSPSPTPSPADASSSASGAATRHARSRPSARPSSTRPPTANSSRSRWKSS